MGRKSVKENKNIYFESREKEHLTREEAAELLGFISADRIEKIENERTTPAPDEVVRMAECYKNPMLCNYYCVNECAIGKKYVPEVKLKHLSQITLDILASINDLNRKKDRLIEISLDGTILPEEEEDFRSIQESLRKMEITVKSLQTWVDHKVAVGAISKSLIDNE